MDRSSQSLSFAHQFDAESIYAVSDHLGPDVAERIARDHPTLCDLITASFLLGRDPLELFGQAAAPTVVE
ncbi:hypothetical protein [Nocardia sp. NPDC050710]|uniref:hypothetical protein n=1 Tax=Nocardia sp. NPDC050710 TaxID=3157220 RepID=UPI0033C65FDB